MTEREIFVAAYQRTNHADRQRFLDEACCADVELRQRVNNLLGLAEGAGSFLESPVGNLDSTADQFSLESPGRQIGPYRIVELIGEGGMGAVYLAQQTEPVKRLVALKVIKAGMDSRQVLARFEAERQALALMDHPNIARVLDAGTTGRPDSQSGQDGRFEKPSYDAGRPYFVMELVKGVPITKFCDERKLPPRERLELFLPVCHAIQHAHQKGIIHRDIKPNNVLVALYDGKPVPKVIDFGVAKAAGQPLTEYTLVTGLGAVVGTPEYMSPEQAELNQLDIDTRSDIYSLGVLLYELLTGTTPLDHKRVKGTGLLEALRLVREEEPPKPSTRLSSSDELPLIAAKRGTEPVRLPCLVRGEIDWIVMKALEKDRSRRYVTASGLASDVESYLAGGTVQAVPPSVGYQMRKFARRNRGVLVSTALVSLMLLALVGGLAWVLSDRAAREARTAFEVDQFLHRAELLYAENKLPEAVAEVQKARGVLGTGDDELHRRVQKRLTDLDTAGKLEEIHLDFSEREARDRQYAEYARVFREYGIDVEALSTEEAATRIAASHIKLDLVLALDRWAASLRSDPRKLEPARRQRLLEISRTADPDPWRLRYNQACEANDLPELREIVAKADTSRLRPRTLAALGNSLREAGDVESAVAFLRNIQRQYPGDFSVNFTFAACLQRLHPTPWNEVLAYRLVALALRPRSYAAQNTLGFTLHSQGKLDEAALYYKKAIEIDPTHAMAHYNLAIVLRIRGKTEEAIACFKKACEYAPNNPYPLNGLAWTLATCSEAQLRDPGRAVALAKRVIELKPEDGNYWTTLGLAHFRADEWGAAITACERSLKMSDGKGTAGTDLFVLAMANWKLARTDEARNWYRQGAEWMEKNDPKNEELGGFRAEAAALLGIGKNE